MMGGRRVYQLLCSPWECPRKDLFPVLRAPLQQLAQFWRADMIAMSPHVKVPPRALLDERRVAAVQVTSIRSIRVGQLAGGGKFKGKKRS